MTFVTGCVTIPVWWILSFKVEKKLRKFRWFFLFKKPIWNSIAFYFLFSYQKDGHFTGIFWAKSSQYISPRIEKKLIGVTTCPINYHKYHIESQIMFFKLPKLQKLNWAIFQILHWALPQWNYQSGTASGCTEKCCNAYFMHFLGLWC